MVININLGMFYKKKINPLYLVLLFILNSCGSGVGDVSEELSEGYTYRVDGRLRYIVPDHLFKDVIYPTVIRYEYNDDFILVLQKPSIERSSKLFSDYMRFRHNSLATLNSNNPDLKPGQYDHYRSTLIADSSLYKLLSRRLSTENTVKDIKESQIIADSIIINDPKYQKVFSRELNYWIISHKEREGSGFLATSKLYGPLSKKEYINKRKELGVPEELSLSIEDY
jgi:hypothetical protein